MSLSSRRAQDPIRVVLIAGLVGVLLLGVAYFFVDALAGRSNAQQGIIQPAAGTYPVMSARRTPVTLSYVTRTGSLRRALASVNNRLPSNACLRVDWLGETMTSVRSDATLVPASAHKLVTAAVALEVLGPTYTFETSIYADVTNDPQETASIYLVGGGDPLLVDSGYVGSEKYPTLHASDLETLVSTVKSTGLRQVTSTISIIDNRYDDLRYVDSWPTSFYGVESGPLGALMFNDATVTGLDLKPDDPGLAAGVQLAYLFNQQGISTPSSVVRISQVPTTAVKIASITSAPLTDIVQEMLVNSDNNTAELLVKEMGLAKKENGTTQSGIEVMNETVAGWGLTSQPTFADGSGLSRINAISCDDFIAILERFNSSFPALLAVAGESGTLRNVFVDTSMEGRMVAKTGTLSGVKSLVGYLGLDNEVDVQFALVMNSTGIDNQNSYRPIWNSLGDALNRAQSSPRPDQLFP